MVPAFLKPLGTQPHPHKRLDHPIDPRAFPVADGVFDASQTRSSQSLTLDGNGPRMNNQQQLEPPVDIYENEPDETAEEDEQFSIAIDDSLLRSVGRR